MNKKVLIIEDDEDVIDLVELHLRRASFTVAHATDGLSGLKEAVNGHYDLVILDLNLPRMDGTEVCKEIRLHKQYLPILMLSSRNEEIDRIIGLEIGADDYLNKPFGVRELVARVKVLLRRCHIQEQARDTQQFELKFGDLLISLDRRQVYLGKEEVKLTATEFDLLTFLAERPGRPFTREQLLEYIWDYNSPNYEKTVNTFINRLRAKIEPDPANPIFIQTVRGIGYKFSNDFN